MGHIWVIYGLYHQNSKKWSWEPSLVFDLLGGRAPCRLHLDREAAVLRVPRRGQENLGASLRRVVDRFRVRRWRSFSFLAKLANIYKLTRIYRVLYGLVWICGKYIEISWNITIVHASKKHDWGHLVVLGSTRWAPVFGRQTSVCEELETPWATSIILIIIIIINCWSAFKSPAYHGCHDSPPVRSFQVADP